MYMKIGLLPRRRAIVFYHLWKDYRAGKEHQLFDKTKNLFTIKIHMGIQKTALNTDTHKTLIFNFKCTQLNLTSS